MKILGRQDYFLQSQVTRAELAELSERCNVPIYLIKNLHVSSPNDTLQNEKDITRIKK